MDQMNVLVAVLISVTFVHVNVNMTWMEAQRYCRGRHTDLASVRNMAENRRLQVLVPTGQRAWIGLSRESWKWSDGTGSAFSFWMSGEPSKTRQNCAAANMKDSGRWQNFCFSSASDSSVTFILTGTWHRFTIMKHI
uniref:C-type lectin domain-containing protein n=1 Tax=Xiphophorus couchianus TaxID=32473 RepID=A0A3B5MF02_9TELE